MTQANTIFGLMAQTSIHAGTGQNTGIIDLPIQREGHSGWPCVFGSAVKGALRSRAEDNKLDNLLSIFGPDTNNAGDYGSAIMVSDARIVLFPVRSLTSQFKWVTCPAVMTRLYEDMQRFGFSPDKPECFTNIPKGEAISPKDFTKIPNGGAISADENTDDIFLEEYRFITRKKSLNNIITLLSRLIKRDEISDALTKQLLLVNNDDFSHLVQHATPVNAHIAINSKTKTVKNTALWYEETLPPETLLYIGISASDARDNNQLTADNVLGGVTGMFTKKPWLQMGGNETVGMGWCTVQNAKETE
jgi:CRISPR-associated protein Cmr4